MTDCTTTPAEGISPISDGDSDRVRRDLAQLADGFNRDIADHVMRLGMSDSLETEIRLRARFGKVAVDLFRDHMSGIADPLIGNDIAIFSTGRRNTAGLPGAIGRR